MIAQYVSSSKNSFLGFILLYTNADEYLNVCISHMPQKLNTMHIYSYSPIPLWKKNLSLNSFLNKTYNHSPNCPNQGAVEITVPFLTSPLPATNHLPKLVVSVSHRLSINSLPPSSFRVQYLPDCGEHLFSLSILLLLSHTFLLCSLCDFSKMKIKLCEVISSRKSKTLCDHQYGLKVPYRGYNL